MSNKPVLSIYPTLIDSFYWVKKMKFREDKVQELLDKINRVPSTTFPEAAKKGVQFEDLINGILNGVRPVPKETPLGVVYDTEDFSFSKSLVDKMAYKLSGAKKQQEYIQADVPTPIGMVKVYGFIDYSYDDKYIDLKTTSRYVFGKYRDNNQHKSYPLLSMLSGKGHKDFIYYVTDFNHIYQEPYKFTGELGDQFVSDVVDFNSWLQENRELITHPKIFNL